MKKVIFSAALLMAAATFSFAGNPKETKEAKAETPTEAKTEASLITYYVLSQTGSNYNITTTAPSPTQCNGGSKPCQFTSAESLGASVPKDDVDNEEGDIQITQTRVSVPGQ
jgi:hypothetical protein